KSRTCIYSCFTLVYWVSLAANALELSNNSGFVGLLVAIHEDVPERDYLLDNVQQFLSKVSARMEETPGRHFLESVTIQVPSTWRRRPNYIDQDVDLYERAQVRLVPGSHTARGMSTLQPRPCGLPGEYILVPDDQVMRKDNVALHLEHQFLQEWVKFRYGVFDELGVAGSKRFPTAYTDGSMLRPVSHAKNIDGVLSRRDGSPCGVTPTGLVWADCCLFLDTRNRTLLKTLLMMPYASPVNPISARYLPTKQNALCQRRSTSEVILSHNDFVLKNIHAHRSKDIVFQVLRLRENSTGNVVLLLDASQQMCAGKWMHLVHRSVARFVQDRVPDAFGLALVALSQDQAQPLSNLTTVGPDSRRALRALVPYDCSTGKGLHLLKGVRAAAKLIKAKTGRSAGGILILVTASSLLDEKSGTGGASGASLLLSQAGLVLSTVALGTRVDSRLETLASATGGRSFAFSTTSELHSGRIDDALAAAASQLMPIRKRDITVSHKEDFRQELKRCAVLADIVSLGGFQMNHIWIATLRTPEAKQRLVDCKELKVKQLRCLVIDPSSTEVRLRLHWVPYQKQRRPARPVTAALVPTSNVENELAGDIGQPEVAVSPPAATVPEVCAAPRDACPPPSEETSPEGLTAMDETTESVKRTLDESSSRAGMTAKLNPARGGRRRERTGVAKLRHDTQVACCTLRVQVRLPAPCSSRYFSPASTSPLSPDVRLFAVNLSVPFKRAYHLAELRVHSHQSQWTPLGKQGEPCGAFERYALAGAFQLAGYSEHSRLVPGAVQDLQVRGSTFSGSKWMIRLSWTAMGAHADAGNVGYVDVRCSQHASELEENFDEAISVRKADVFRGSLSPMEPNKKHELVIQVRLQQLRTL
ncbi:unnamed protein product, partial [Ixodes hexagonus]